LQKSVIKQVHSLKKKKTLFKNKNMKLKICGLNNEENIRSVIQTEPDYMGFIFYEKSPRYIGSLKNLDVILSIPKHIKKVGVFVNATIETIMKQVEKYELDYVQLHSNESVDFCSTLKEAGIGVIKTFSIAESIDFNFINAFESVCDFFLFDTQTSAYGGSGKQFNWQLLKGKEFSKSVFLSGGISITDVDFIKKEFPSLYAIDVNSKFETEAGIKDIEQLKRIKQLIQH
jgi:phosphoribosylanthranilate isomerase